MRTLTLAFPLDIDAGTTFVQRGTAAPVITSNVTRVRYETSVRLDPASVQTLRALLETKILGVFARRGWSGWILFMAGLALAAFIVRLGTRMADAVLGWRPFRGRRSTKARTDTQPSGTG